MFIHDMCAARAKRRVGWILSDSWSHRPAPLARLAFRRADELATAMECRCYHGGEGRTRLKQLRFHAADWAVLALFAALLSAVIVLKLRFRL